MAFVPKTKNAEVPRSSAAVYARDALAAQQRHRQAIRAMRPAIDNKWGRIQNGSWSNKRPTYPHIVANMKRAQLEDERARDIENENFKLLEKLSKIIERSQDPTHGTREWGDGMRLTSTQVPVIDHCVPAQTTTFGAAIVRCCTLPEAPCPLSTPYPRRGAAGALGVRCFYAPSTTLTRLPLSAPPQS